MDLSYWLIWVFPKLYKVGNAANKGLHGEEQNKFCKKIISSVDRAQNLLVYTL